MTTLNQLAAHLRRSLSGATGDEGEARAMTRLIVEDLWGYDPMQTLFHGDEEVSDFREQQAERIAGRVAGGEPLQYVLGKARFMGNDYRVTADTLIPRPETAGLVDMAVKELGGRKDQRVLDIGTGSGVIAVALAKALPFASVTATDISGKALEVAEENARTLHARVTFRREDVFAMEDTPVPWDLIVSNPPYVAQREKRTMDKRVWAFEPEGALFVPDGDPLVFYRAIGLYGTRNLAPGGWLMFEINPLFADGLAAMLRAQGYEDVETERDYKGNLRYASARWTRG